LAAIIFDLWISENHEMPKTGLKAVEKHQYRLYCLMIECGNKTVVYILRLPGPWQPFASQPAYYRILEHDKSLRRAR